MSGFLTEAIATAVRYEVGETPQTEFTVPFPFDAATDLVVYVGDTLVTAFSVAGTVLDGFFITGAVLTLVTPAESVTVAIERQTEVEQQSLFPTSGTFQVRAANGEFSRVWMALQDLERQIKDRIGVVAGEAPLVNYPARASRANKIMAFDAAGEPALIDALPEGDFTSDLIRNIVYAALADIFPPGVIVGWAGEIGDVPEGWSLCDGTNGTPDYSGKFILGAGGGFTQNTTGGSLTIGEAAAVETTTGGRSLTIAQLPIHDHGGDTGEADDDHFHYTAGTPGGGEGIATSWAPGNTNNYILQGGTADTSKTSLAVNPHTHPIPAAGSGDPHDHPVTFPVHDHTAVRPPYYVQAYIMRTGIFVLPVFEAAPPDVIEAARKFPFQFAASDETTALEAGVLDIQPRAPFAFSLTSVRASLRTAATTGTFEIDILANGVSILSTNLTIDATETTSTTAAVPAVLAASSISDDALITVEIIDEADGTATGLKVLLLGATA